MTVYESLLDNMVKRIESLGKCSIEPASDMMIKVMTVARELELLYGKLDFYEKQLFPDTAEGEYLIKHGESKGIFKKGAAKSSGFVTFKATVATATPILIPKGTLVGCTGIPDVTFATNTDVTLSANALSVQSAVTSVEEGVHTSVSPLLVDMLITPLAGIKGVSNPAKISGGSDGESDESYRLRVVEGYKKISNGCNLHYYEQLARSVDGVWYAKAVYKTSPSAQVVIYVENNTRTISASKIAEVLKVVNSSRELGVSVVVQAATKQVVNVDIMLKVDNLTGGPTYIITAEQVVAQYVGELSIAEAFSITKLGARLLAISGVLDVEFTEPATSAFMTASQIADLGSISINCI